MHSVKTECLSGAKTFATYFGVIWVILEHFIAVKNGHIKFLGNFEDIYLTETETDVIE